MALPNLAPVFIRRMSPRDTMDIYPVLTRGDTVKDILQTGEEVTSFTIGLTAEAVAAGLQIDPDTRYANTVFFIRLSVNPAIQGSVVFDRTGLVLGVEIRFATNINEREKTYTVGVKVVNK